MRNAVIAALCCLSIACSSTSEKKQTLAELAASNQANLMKLSTGMTRNDVVTVMGQQQAQTRDGIVSNPWTIETSTSSDGTQYEILYYVTKKNQPFTPVRKSLTTPILLKNGVVVGWGESALQSKR